MTNPFKDDAEKLINEKFNNLELRLRQNDGKLVLLHRKIEIKDDNYTTHQENIYIGRIIPPYLRISETGVFGGSFNSSLADIFVDPKLFIRNEFFSDPQKLIVFEPGPIVVSYSDLTNSFWKTPHLKEEKKIKHFALEVGDEAINAYLNQSIPHGIEIAQKIRQLIYFIMPSATEYALRREDLTQILS